MNKRLLLVIVGGLVLIAAIIYFIFIYDYNKTDQPTPDTNQPGANVDQTPVIIESPVPTPVTPGTVAPETQGREQANRLAMSFAERYGTSSSQADFSNLEDLEIFMTSALQERTRQYIAAEQAKATGTADYSATVTKAAFANVTAYDEAAGTATVTVSTKRQEEKPGSDARTYSQDLKLSLKRSGTEWLVDSVEWVK